MFNERWKSDHETRVQMSIWSIYQGYVPTNTQVDLSIVIYEGDDPRKTQVDLSIVCEVALGRRCNKLP